MTESSNSGTTPPEDAFRSFHNAERLQEEPLIRVMALHALAYCERLFYLEEVEEIRRADANVFAGRRLHETLDKGNDITTLELASERLGIRGKIDCIRRESGQLIVCEHKKGRSKEGKEAWPSDRLQAMAYALLLAEHSGKPADEALVRYHADHRTISIPFELDSAEKEVGMVLARAKELRLSPDRPPVPVHERQCRSCSLVPVCLPEEERFAGGGEDLPQRLFPEDDDRRIVHVVEQGSSIQKDGEQFVITTKDGTRKGVPGMMVMAIVLHGNVQISTQAIHFCAANEIGLHWLSYGGFYVGSLTPGAGAVQRKNRQYQAFQIPVLRARLTARLVHAKIENQLKYLLRLTRGDSEGRTPVVEEGLARLRALLHDIDAALISVDTDESGLCQGDVYPEELVQRLRGYEGSGTREYFQLLPHVLNMKEDDFLYFAGRNRRPPKDPFNALLSFGYALLYRDCVGALLTVGLDPAFGFMHTPRSAAYPLALDLMDVFRLLLWDIPMIGSINRRQWTESDFDIFPGQVWLNPDGRRKAIALYEARKAEKWKHPVLDYSLSYRRTIELEARLMEKEWLGSPGLFGRLRIR
ncbi:MAG: type I-MYXAN CRISPR-associated endonuclease Cas1 [Candidatus Riflebacteria bacterium]|nr:type I-MYXAN CRISPR-associated endonuclease Cas1 [Candidatus Riflebacteria bacterium]